MYSKVIDIPVVVKCTSYHSKRKIRLLIDRFSTNSSYAAMSTTYGFKFTSMVTFNEVCSIRRFYA